MGYNLRQMSNKDRGLTFSISAILPFPVTSNLATSLRHLFKHLTDSSCQPLLLRLNCWLLPLWNAFWHFFPHLYHLSLFRHLMSHYNYHTKSKNFSSSIHQLVMYCLLLAPPTDYTLQLPDQQQVSKFDFHITRSLFLCLCLSPSHVTWLLPHNNWVWAYHYYSYVGTKNNNQYKKKVGL